MRIRIVSIAVMVMSMSPCLAYRRLNNQADVGLSDGVASLFHDIFRHRHRDAHEPSKNVGRERLDLDAALARIGDKIRILQHLGEALAERCRRCRRYPRWCYEGPSDLARPREQL